MLATRAYHKITRLESAHGTLGPSSTLGVIPTGFVGYIASKLALPGPIYFAHAARAEGHKYFVGTQACARSQLTHLETVNAKAPSVAPRRSQVRFAFGREL